MFAVRAVNIDVKITVCLQMCASEILAAQFKSPQHSQVSRSMTLNEEASLTTIQESLPVLCGILPLQCRLSYGVRTPPCTIACIYICAHVKDPIVHIKVRWIKETQKHPACTVGWVARLCRSWFSPGKATRISHGRNPNGTIQL